TELLQRQLKEIQAELAGSRAAPARPAAAPAGPVFTKGPPAPPPPERVYLRQWQIRGVVDVAPGISLGASAENPSTIFLGSTATAPLGLGGPFVSGTTLVNGQLVNFVNTGGGGDFLQTINVTPDQAPDIIEKVAFDPGWGHYEIYGLQR